MNTFTYEGVPNKKEDYVYVNIHDNAFKNCVTLENINLTFILETQLKFYGNPFLNCRKLKSFFMRLVNDFNESLSNELLDYFYTTVFKRGGKRKSISKSKKRKSISKSKKRKSISKSKKRKVSVKVRKEKVSVKVRKEKESVKVRKEKESVKVRKEKINCKFYYIIPNIFNYYKFQLIHHIVFFHTFYILDYIYIVSNFVE